MVSVEQSLWISVGDAKVVGNVCGRRKAADVNNGCWRWQKIPHIWRAEVERHGAGNEAVEHFFCDVVEANRIFYRQYPAVFLQNVDF